MRTRQRRRLDILRLSWMAVAAVSLAAGPLFAATTLTTQLVGSGFTRPVFVTHPPGDTQRLFVVEQRVTGNRGRIRIIRNGATLPAPFLTTPTVATGNEQGLLGMAFSPDYATSGRFYIYYNDSGGTCRLARYTVSAFPDTANPTGQIIYSAAHPFTNHNGGWLAFGPDGYLWLAMGDGGSGDDPGDRAQNINVPLGKLLRFDVSGAGNAVGAPDNPFFGPTTGLDEVFAFGLRNPWRCSFDRLTGDLIIGDVGQLAWEEIDFAPADSLRGLGWNWGWRCYEGNAQHIASATTPCGSCYLASCPIKFPAYAYSHASGRCSVTGGYVYRGCKIPDLQGTYFFADYCGDQIYTGRFVNGALTGVVNRATELDPSGADTIVDVISFSEDADGELLICEQGGQIWRVVARPPGVAEADMPALQVQTAGGDVLGSTTPGNALLPGITPFADPGNRLVGVGYMSTAQIRACPESSPNCQVTHVRLGTFDIDVDACVDPIEATLTRRFVFTNTSAGPANLNYRDVVTPYLDGTPDVVRAFDAATDSTTALLALSDAVSPDLYIVHQGFAKGATFSMDADTVVTLEARVAADQPLANRTSAGPAEVGMAIGFDFGPVPPVEPVTLTVVTRLQTKAPTSTGDPEVERFAQPSLRVVGTMPFRGEVRFAVGMPLAGRAQLEVYDVRGRRVRRLWDGDLASGVNTSVWDGRDDKGRTLGAGLYFVRLRTTQGERSVRVVRVQ